MENQQDGTLLHVMKFIRAFEKKVRGLIPFIALALLILAFGLLAPTRFLTFNNLILLLQQSAITAIVGYGMTLVIAQGNIDLSVGSVVALSGIIGAIVAKTNPWLGIFASIGTGTICGLTNGLAYIFLRVPTFIVTLGMLQLARGLSIFITKGMPVYIDSSIQWIGRWPGVVIIAGILFLLFFFTFTFTKLGKYTRAIGGDERVAGLAGVPLHSIKLANLVLCGLLAGIGGFLTAARLGAGSATVGEGFELDVIGAVVLGGTPLTGGMGTVYGSILGALIMAIMGNGLIILGVSSEIQMVIKGAVLVLAVFLTLEREKIGIIK